MATPGIKAHAFTMLGLALTIVTLQGAWALALQGRTSTLAHGADPQAQLGYIAEQPVNAASSLAQDFVRSVPRLTYEAVGVLGWLDAHIPVLVAVFLGMMIVLVALGEPGLPPGWTTARWLGVLIGVGGALALHAMNFVWWTPPGASSVAGIQGRHLLPFVPMLFVVVGSPGRMARPLGRLRPIFITAFVVVSSATTLLTVFYRYY
jgi:uncharacterized membrane protein